jgi:hypothetical protein
MSKGKRYIDQSPGITWHELPVVLSQWSHMDRAVMDSNMYKLLPTREILLSLQFQGFYYESITQAQVVHLTDLNFSILRSPLLGQITKLTVWSTSSKTPPQTGVGEDGGKEPSYTAGRNAR